MTDSMVFRRKLVRCSAHQLPRKPQVGRCRRRHFQMLVVVFVYATLFFRNVPEAAKNRQLLWDREWQQVGGQRFLRPLRPAFFASSCVWLQQTSAESILPPCMVECNRACRPALSLINNDIAVYNCGTHTHTSLNGGFLVVNFVLVVHRIWISELASGEYELRSACYYIEELNHYGWQSKLQKLK